jgi:tyrosyl-tRNA synthetase
MAQANPAFPGQQTGLTEVVVNRRFTGMTSISSPLDELSWRGLLHQQTDGASEALSSGQLSAYCGFDPTAPSLHVGNLVPVMGLVHLQRSGHRPIALVGGGTGLIGDPSGKASERQLNSLEVVRENSAGIRAQLERFLDFSGSNAALMEDNANWLLELGAVDFMRDVGKHFTISYMLAKESVSSRLQTGISFTEFSYMLLQAYDFLELNRRHGVSLQIGGSDQWGNITAGTELIRRVTGESAHGFTLPLVTNSTGTKFGKTESGSVWLDPARTSPYRFYQFWVNTDDADAARYLRYFTLLSRGEIVELEQEIATRPEARVAQARLAAEVTRTVHGADAARTAAEISSLLFDGGDPSALSADAVAALAAEIPFCEVRRGELLSDNADGTPPDATAELVSLLVTGKLAASRGAARRLLEQGGVYMNNRRVAADQKFILETDLLAGSHVLLRKGAREHLLVTFGARG